MNDRRFGHTDLHVSEICFGPMRFSAKAPGDDDQSRTGKRALERALERGVNFIHSSYEYGTRWAVGQVLKDHPQRHNLHHIIKVPVPDFDDGGVFDATQFRRRVEQALRDLHTDHIDVIQHLQRAQPNTDELRIPNIPAVHEPMMAVFEKLREEGKVGYLATFPYAPGFAAAAMKTGDFRGMVAYYNPIEMEMAGFFEPMAAKGRGFFCIRPFMAGLLTDRRVDRRRLPADDRFGDERWDAAYDRLGTLQSALGEDVTSWTAFAIKFALCHPIVTSLIVGLNTPAQVDGVLDAADGNYPDLKVFDKALEIFRAQGPVSN
ncbi:MAG: aldo/keto reductase [Candidatus Poribacteria bacterium]|nr:aldo/keto reductase [Candidatus Poribacteria bacterium]